MADRKSYVQIKQAAKEVAKHIDELMEKYDMSDEEMFAYLKLIIKDCEEMVKALQS
jgi:hypothetical protein